MFYSLGLDRIETDMPNLREKAILPGFGYWIRQEKPVEMNEP
jgi:hypothetical protein